MRLGLVTDIHNHADELADALALFREQGVDQVVTVGDTCDAFGGGTGAGRVAELLLECNAVGVWGNHDFGLCCKPGPDARARFGDRVLTLMSRMQPRLLLERCHFSHKDASVDPHDVTQLWELGEGRLDLLEKAALGFGACTQPWQFIGHYHRWWAATPAGRLEWDGSTPLTLAPGERYFIVIAPIFNRCCALLDTNTAILTPFSP